MKIIKVIFMVVITMAITITITMKYNIGQEDNVISEPHEVKPLPMPVKRVSRFLANVNNNPRAVDQCKKDNDICNVVLGGATNSTCCSNKCVDLSTDKSNCGACKNKCKFTDACCGGECVNLAYDKRHCGTCDNKCMPGGYCIYGMCNYA